MMRRLAVAGLFLRGIPLTGVATISCVIPFHGPLKMKIYHRDTETPRMQMWRLFRPREYRGQNKRHGFLKEYLEKEEVSEEMSFSSPSISSFKRGFTNFSEGVLALIKIRKTFSSLCLCASSEAGGESPCATGCSNASQRDTPNEKVQNRNVLRTSIDLASTAEDTHGNEINATFAFYSLWNYFCDFASLVPTRQRSGRVVNNAPGMCQGIFRFSNQNGSWHGQESAGKKSGNNSQLVGLQNGANVDENLSWHFSPKAGQVEIRKSEISGEQSLWFAVFR